MTTLVLANASGAPGTTVTCLGLTLAWPSDVLLVDADRTASQAVLAGYLGGTTAHGHGLQRVLQAFRERGDLAGAVSAERLPLPQPAAPRDQPDHDGTPRRDFLPGFTHLGSVDLFEAAWQPLSEVFRAAPHDVVIDAGRLGHRGLPPELTASADLVGLVCRTSLVSLAGVRMHLPALLDAAPPGRCGLVLVGPGRPYPADEVAAQFGVPVIAQVAWDPRTASDVAHGTMPAQWHRTPLARSFVAAAAGLKSRAEARVTDGVRA